MAILSEPIMLFGGYVESISASVGWGSQSSTAQVILVYEEDGPKSEEDFTSNFPPLGTCVGLKVGSFTFAGIFQRYSHERTLDGYKFNLVLESPSKVLDGVQVILDTFQGSNYHGYGTFTNQVNNVWNPFAILENYTYGGIFGGSGVNATGFQGYLLYNLLEEISRGEHPFGGPIVYGESSFELDLTDLKAALTGIGNYETYRIKGPLQSLASIIEDVCSIIMYDYVVSIQPKTGDFINGVISNPVIKIKMMDRSRPPDANIIKQIVDTKQRNQELIRAEVGKELNDAVTQKVVVGGAATRYVLASENSMTQIWGRTKNIKPEYVTKIVLDDGTLYPEDPKQEVDLMEVRCAMHSFDSWVLYHLLRKDKGIVNTTIDKYYSYLFTNIRFDQFVIRRILAGTITGVDLIDTRLKHGSEKYKQFSSSKQVHDTLQRIHNSIRAAGEEYWGRKYFVKLPFEPGGFANNMKFVTEDFQVINSWEMADSAWWEPPVYVSDVSFYDGDGKLKPTASWTFNPKDVDYTNLGNGYGFDQQNNISAVINIEKTIEYRDGYPVCSVDLPAVSIFDEYATELHGFRSLLRYFYPNNQDVQDNIERMYSLTSDSGANVYGVAPMRVQPKTIGLPQVSTRYRYGPWWKGLEFNGKAEVIIDDSISPDTFGGLDAMGFVGETYATVINAEISGREIGSVELPEIPSSNIVDRFLVSGPYVTGMDISIGIGGFTTSYKFNTWTPEFGKFAKYNIDRLANLTKAYYTYRQNRRSKIELRPFEKPFYKEQLYGKVGRQALLQMGGTNLFACQLMPDQKDKTDKTDKKRTIVNPGTAQNQLQVISQNFDDTFACSPEQLFTPIKTIKEKKANQDNVPQTTIPKQESEETFVYPNSDNLDPYHAKPNDFSMAIFGDTFDENSDINLNNLHSDDSSVNSNTNANQFSLNNPNNNGADPNVTVDPPEVIKTVGFRFPMMASGWGYDVRGLPVPSDDEDIGNKRQTWKTGPVELRWDYLNKVWTSGFKIAEGYLAEPLSKPSSFDKPTQATVITMLNINDYESDDDDDPNTFPRGEDLVFDERGSIIVRNRDTNLSLKSGTYVIAIRINYEWRIIYYSCV